MRQNTLIFVAWISERPLGLVQRVLGPVAPALMSELTNGDPRFYGSSLTGSLGRHLAAEGPRGRRPLHGNRDQGPRTLSGSSKIPDPVPSDRDEARWAA